MAKYSFSEHRFQFKDSENNLKRQTVLLNLDDPETLHAHQWYERACTAEYIIENDDYNKLLENNEDIAFKVACAIRDYMDKHMVTESNAIKAIFKNFDIEKYR